MKRESGREKRERQREKRERENERGLHNHSLSFSQLPDKHGITALLAAVYEDHEKCVRVLVSSVSQAIPI